MDILVRDSLTYILLVKLVTIHVLLVQELITAHVQSVMWDHNCTTDNVLKQVGVD